MASLCVSSPLLTFILHHHRFLLMGFHKSFKLFRSAIGFCKSRPEYVKFDTLRCLTGMPEVCIHGSTIFFI
ncbi:hypothetical protein ACSQ67_016935 [Phaseolus vulgaris]